MAPGLARRERHVDDMLAWLREQGYDVSFGSQRTHLNGERMLGERDVLVKLQPLQDHQSNHRGRTLHAALEQAVLAVGRAGIEPASDAL